MNELRMKLMAAYTAGIITLDNFRVLNGLCNAGDEAGAKKGLDKLTRRHKRQQKEKEVQNHDSQGH